MVYDEDVAACIWSVIHGGCGRGGGGWGTIIGAVVLILLLCGLHTDGGCGC